MIEVIDDLAKRAENQGVGTFGTDIFAGRSPDQPDTCLVLTPYQAESNRLHGPKNIPVDERLAVQAMARAVSLDDAADLAKKAYDALQFRHETLNSGRTYAWSIAVQYPSYIGIDENNRVLVVFNLRLRRHRTTGIT